MDWIQVIIILAAFSGFFLFLFSKMDGIRKDIHDETKDFHGRLCALEEKYNQIIMPKKEIIKK